MSAGASLFSSSGQFLVLLIIGTALGGLLMIMFFVLAWNALRIMTVRKYGIEANAKLLSKEHVVRTRTKGASSHTWQFCIEWVAAISANTSASDSDNTKATDITDDQSKRGIHNKNSDNNNNIDINKSEAAATTKGATTTIKISTDTDVRNNNYRTYIKYRNRTKTVKSSIFVKYHKNDIIPICYWTKYPYFHELKEDIEASPSPIRVQCKQHWAAIGCVAIFVLFWNSIAILLTVVMVTPSTDNDTPRQIIGVLTMYGVACFWVAFGCATLTLIARYSYPGKVIGKQEYDKRCRAITHHTNSNKS